MIRNLKTLGLALVAVFALSAVGASAASAQQGVFTTSDGSAKVLKGTLLGTGNANALTAFGEQVRCPNGTYKGTEVGSATNGVPNEATTATVTPTYGTCEAQQGETILPGTTVDTNGCDFVLHVGETTENEEHTYGITGDEVCPAGESIVVTVRNKLGGLLLCKISVGPVSGVTGADFIHTTEGEGDDIDMVGTFGNFTAQKSGLCGSHTDNEAKLDVNVTIQAEDSSAVTITD